MLEVKYAVDMFFSFAAHPNDKNLSFGARFDLTEMSVQYTDTISKILLNRKDIV